MPFLSTPQILKKFTYPDKGDVSIAATENSLITQMEHH